MACRGVRGATTVAANEREEILAATRELLVLMIRRNEIAGEDVGSDAIVRSWIAFVGQSATPCRGYVFKVSADDA